MAGFQLLGVNHDGCHMWGRKYSLFPVHPFIYTLQKALHVSCHLGCQPVQEYLPKCSTSTTLCLVAPPGKIVCVSGRLDDIPMDMPRSF